jgi:hypothetical protein
MIVSSRAALRAVRSHAQGGRRSTPGAPLPGAVTGCGSAASPFQGGRPLGAIHLFGHAVALSGGGVRRINAGDRKVRSMISRKRPSEVAAPVSIKIVLRLSLG